MWRVSQRHLSVHWNKLLWLHTQRSTVLALRSLLKVTFAKSLIHFNPLKSGSSTHPGEPPSLSPDGAGGVVKLKQFFTKLLEKKNKAS